MSEAGDRTIVDGAESDEPAEPTAISVGPTVLASRYELLGLLGSGGIAVTRDGVMTPRAREQLQAEAPIVGAPRRSAFNAQLRIEACARAGLLEEALCNYPLLEEAAFIDIAWLDRCVVLALLREGPEHRALRKSAGARVERVLDAIDSGASGFRLRAG